MFFCTYDHYNEEQPIYYIYNIKNEERECFVCFDIKAYNEATPITLKKQRLYITDCDCDSFVHTKCLQLWLDKNKNCPICRIIVRAKPVKINNVNKIINNGINFTFYIITKSKNLLKLFSLLFFIYFLYINLLNIVTINFF